MAWRLSGIWGSKLDPPEIVQEGPKKFQWGFLGSLTDSQQKCVEQMKEHIFNKWGMGRLCPYQDKDPLFSFSIPEERDALLLCYLRARDFDIEKSKIMLDNCIEWRTSCNIAPGRMHDPAVIPQILFAKGAQPYFVDSGMHDKEGRPYLVGRTCLIDNKDMSNEAHLTAVTLVLEHGLVYRVRYPIESCNYILDLRQDDITEKGITAITTTTTTTTTTVTAATTATSTTAATTTTAPNTDITAAIVTGSGGTGGGLEVLREGIRRASEYYPECLGKVYIIGAGWGFYMLWKIMSLWISARTAEKFVFLGGNWQQQLLEHFDSDQLFQEFGGTGPPLGGKEFINRAKEMYIKNASKGH